MRLQLNIHFHIFIIEQPKDGRKFNRFVLRAVLCRNEVVFNFTLPPIYNRGKLLNIGFDLASREHDSFIFHDVDLLPGYELGPYYAAIPTESPMHIAKCWPRSVIIWWLTSCGV